MIFNCPPYEPKEVIAGESEYMGWIVFNPNHGWENTDFLCKSIAGVYKHKIFLRVKFISNKEFLHAHNCSTPGDVFRVKHGIVVWVDHNPSADKIAKNAQALENKVTKQSISYSPKNQGNDFLSPLGARHKKRNLPRKFSANSSTSSYCSLSKSNSKSYSDIGNVSSRIQLRRYPIFFQSQQNLNVPLKRYSSFLNIQSPVKLFNKKSNLKEEKSGSLKNLDQRTKLPRKSDLGRIEPSSSISDLRLRISNLYFQSNSLSKPNEETESSKWDSKSRHSTPKSKRFSLNFKFYKK